ncbi:hypothetical protein PTSG_10113 [Salpingoeca rosetta]|uniref:Uncharacterized protein n=1 Tax=Salpingoeca rosetta (strain ATCC 50818 / BSB-021) TaxID=946362 RepID=F2UPJ0_SALR5|nr:uncharacterized protein PTSG_10113 [Salpingoeca rosetta]EGD79545.1 hypothetical protein PTSG_10113 [Salpingoeca rosetta]|eukprot:XP_004989026.1 hypothetical protein PTSG_10113 [Salpingoeca rosetta]
MRKAAIAGLAGISAIVLLTVMSFMRHSAHIPQPDMAMERRLQEVDKAGGDTSNTAEHAQDGVTACETPTLSSFLVPNAQEYANFKAKPAAPKKQHILVTV